jgi:hypothetical protein
MEKPRPSRWTSGLSLFIVLGSACSGSSSSDDTSTALIDTVPTCQVDTEEGTVWCQNGIIQVRTTVEGITWFDVFHAGEQQWYVNKNNIQWSTRVPGGDWLNSELTDVEQSAEVLSATDAEIVARLHVVFSHGARIYLDMTMEAGSSIARFELHSDTDSEVIDGLQWHVTFGQAEAVQGLDFDGNSIDVKDLETPFSGDSLQAQHVEWFNDLEDLNFVFSGDETEEPDPANPSWMTRVLGLQQHITWHVPMGDQDLFAFEARDRPWKEAWEVPATIPWIEGLWFVRPEGLVEGDALSYGIDNMEDYQ